MISVADLNFGDLEGLNCYRAPLQPATMGLKGLAALAKILRLK